VSRNPSCQSLLRDLPRGKAQDNRRGSFLRRIEIHAVESEEFDHRGQSRPLLPVNKGMIARDAKTVRRSERSKISFAIRELVDPPCERRFQKPEIADAVSAAEQRKLLGVEIENNGEIEPFRLFHFASAL
jgi:hypothetical protein